MDVFSDIKEKLTIQDVIVTQTGLQMGKSHLKECPFCSGHDCFSIPKGKEIFKCHQCGKGGDVFTFLEEHGALEKKAALEKAAELAGVKLEERKPRNPPKLSDLDKIRLETAAYYHGNVMDPAGKAYLVELRGHQPETLSKLQVGFSDGGLLGHLKSKGFFESDILKTGLARVIKADDQQRLVDFFGRGLAVFPHFLDGRVLHFTQKDPEPDSEKKKKFQLPANHRSDRWRFYNQDALRRFSEIILVEGENDLLSVVDAEHENVSGLIGQISDVQIKLIRSHASKKMVYLWMDNDEDPQKLFAKGFGYIRKICKGQKDTNIRIIRYPREFNDPDEFIQKFSGDIRKEINRLKEEAVDYLTWEIENTAELSTLEDKLRRLKELKIFEAVADLVEIEKQIFVEKLVEVGFSTKAVNEQLEALDGLKVVVQRYLTSLENKKDADPNQIASFIFTGFSCKGRFFYDRSNKVYLLYHRRIYEVGSNRPFNALIKKHTTLLPTKEPGRSVWESLASEAYIQGNEIEMAAWMHTDRKTDTIYINLNSPDSKILKINKSGITQVENGLNDEGVLLKASGRIMPATYMPEVPISEGIGYLRDLVFRFLACEHEQRYLILASIVATFFYDFSINHGLFKFSGGSGSGKTSAARLISVLLYGESILSETSAAAAFSVSSDNPLLVLDNLETDDFTKSIMKFLLLAATGGVKEKRTSGTETDTTQEKPRCLVIITAIEPFSKPELINRTFDIDFSPEFKDEIFLEDDVIAEIMKKRDVIVSSILKLIQEDILPNVEHRRDYFTILKKEYRGHAKERADDYLSVLMLILEKLLKYIPFYSEDHMMHGIESGGKEIRRSWIEYQNAKAKDNEAGTNNIINLLDGMIQKYIHKMRDAEAEPHKDYEEAVFSYTHPDYLLEVIKTPPRTIKEEDGIKLSEPYMRCYIEFVATGSQIWQALNIYCKDIGKKNPFENPRQFGARLNSETKILIKSGWELVTRPGAEPYYKVVMGQRFWKFRYTLVR